jgi:sporulation integral membrane protein YtvI
MINKVLFLIAFVLGVFVFFNFLFGYIAPFFAGFVVSLILEPLVRLLNERFKIHRGIAAIFLILILMTLIIVLSILIVNNIIAQAFSFASNVPQYIANIEKTFASFEDKITVLKELIPKSIYDAFAESSGGILSSLASSSAKFVGNGMGQGGISIVKALPNVLVVVILCIISAFFFTKDMPMIKEKANKYIPQWIRKNAKGIRGGVFTAVGGYIKAQLIIMSVTGSICVLGLTIIRYPYSLFVGILIAVFDALPIFGSGAILWPWAAYSFLMNNYRFGIALLIIYGAIFLTRQFLEPKVLSAQIGLYPILTLMSIFVGVKAFGFLGFIIGPFVVICAKIILTAERENSGE